MGSKGVFAAETSPPGERGALAGQVYCESVQTQSAQILVCHWSWPAGDCWSLPAFPDRNHSRHRGKTRLGQAKESCSTQFLNKFIIS